MIPHEPRKFHCSDLNTCYVVYEAKNSSSDGKASIDTDESPDL